VATRPDYYKILHVAPDAPEAIIRASYRTLMQALRMHPDLGGDHERATLINEAFRTLGDADSRARYDEKLRRAAEAAAEDTAATAATVVLDEGPAVAQAKQTVEHALCPFCRSSHDVSLRNADDAMCEACGAPLFAASYHPVDGDVRRAVDRLPRNARVSFRTSSDRQTVSKGVSQDVSLNGMRFVTTTFLNAGERLIIACDYCIAAAIVRNVRRADGIDTGWECGVEFFTLRIRRQRGGLISTVA
jgi:curved DNA-binding protein CbpA